MIFFVTNQQICPIVTQKKEIFLWRYTESNHMAFAPKNNSKSGNQQNNRSKTSEKKALSKHPNNDIARMRDIIKGRETIGESQFVPEHEKSSTHFGGEQQEKNESGEKLNSNTQQKMESGFQTDFKDVRIHTGPEASELTDEADARALTYGQDIFFKNGEYRPGTAEGDALIAHELTHTVQQRGAEQEESNSNEAQLEKDANIATAGLIQKILNEGKQFGRKVMPKLKGGLVVSRCTNSKYNESLVQFKEKRNQINTSNPKAHPEIKDAAVELGGDLVIMDSYQRFQDKEVKSGLTWGFFFSRDKSLAGSAKKPEKLDSWSDFDKLNLRQKLTLFQISRITGEVIHDRYSKNSLTLSKLKNAYDYWPNGQYAIHQSGSSEASNTCNVFVGNSLYNAGLTAHKGSKLWSANEIYKGAGGEFQEIDKAYAQPGDIAAYGGHVAVIVLVDVENERFVTREGFIEPKGSEKERSFKELLGLEKTELKIMRKK